MQGVEPSALASSIQDEEVQKHLKSFFNARDELRKQYVPIVQLCG